MSTAARGRDPGLQPERTALSWHRTAFSSLVLALLTTRSGVCRGEIILVLLGGLATLSSLALVIISLRRQHLMTCDTELTSLTSVRAKYLICNSLSINALAVVLQSVIDLY